MRSTLNRPEIRKGVLALHAATDFKELWEAYCKLAKALMPTQELNFAISLDRGRPSMSFSATLNFSPEMWETSYHASGLPEVEAAAPGRKVLRMTDFMLPELRHSVEEKFRVDYLSREQLFYAAVLAFWRGRKFAHLMGLGRTFAQGDFTDPEMALLEILHPDLETALQRVLKIERQQAEITALSQSLREERLPMLVLDWKLRATFSNPEAIGAIRHWGGCQAARLKTRAAPLLPPRIKDAWHGFREELQRDGQHNLTAIARKLTRRLNLEENGAPAAEIIYSKPAHAPFDAGRFIIRFAAARPAKGGAPSTLLKRLTMSEQAVSELVGEGKSNDEVSFALGLSVHTVRAHLRSIFAKLGVHSRAELVAHCHRRTPDLLR